MNISKARPQDLGKLKEIVDVGNRHGGFPPEWIRQSASDCTPSKETLDAQRVFVAEEADEVTGFYSLDEYGKLDQLYVLPEYLGTGCTKELFLHAMEQQTGKRTGR